MFGGTGLGSHSDQELKPAAVVVSDAGISPDCFVKVIDPPPPVCEYVPLPTSIKGTGFAHVPGKLHPT
jgi:hypothetical protein